MPLKTGPLTADELSEIWASASDPGYRDPLLDAGDGNGLEIWSQFFAQLERVSKAIDVTTQAMFIAPWSGQTNPPASGAAKSVVTLKITRTKLLEFPLFLQAGTFVVGERTTDWGDEGPVEVETGRLYVLTEDAFFFPGEQGPFEVEAEATRPGYGYDNPLPETIVAIEQKGAGFENDLATIDSTIPIIGAGNFASAHIAADNQADMFVPQHSGQQVVMTAGLNSGMIARMTFFASPDPSAGIGSGEDLELLWTVSGTTFSGTFEPGEIILVKNGGTPVANARLLLERPGTLKRVAFVLRQQDAAILAGYTLLGTVSGATMTILSISHATILVDEAPVGGVGGASWRILDWEDDWGLSCTNEESPSGGRSPMLDELGYERGVGRGPNEPDVAYRERVREIADVVAPNAIKRTVARAYPFSWALYEAGLTWPGFFFDGTNEPASATPGRAECDAYDTDVIVYGGGPAVGTFVIGEPVVVEDELFRMAASGYAGRVSASEFLLVRTNGGLSNPPGTFRVRGITSGATFPITDETIPATVEERKRRTWLDYEQFRGFFWIEVGGLDLGEFGFAYDIVGFMNNAYDVGGAYDGFPASAADYYRTLWQAVERARAGGVGFELIRRV